MKILHIYKTYFPDTYGGVEQVIKTISNETSKFNCTNTLLTLSLNPTQPNEFSNLHVHRFPITLNLASCPMSIKAFSHFQSLAEQHDIIHYHFPWPFADLMALFANKIRKPSLVTYHSDIVRQRLLKKIYQPLMQKFLKHVDIIVPTSENCLNTSKDLVHHKKKCKIIPIGIDENHYPSATIERLAFWQKKVGSHFMLFIGVLRYYKGLHFLLDAVANTNIPFVIAGNGPLEQSLKAQAKKLGLTSVYFVGSVSDEDKIALLQLCRAVVLPSHLRSEAFGVTLLEGLLFKKPLISTEIGTGTSFVNQDQVTGFVVEPANSQALRQAMLKLMADDALCASMGAAAYQRYQAEFSAQLMGERYLKLYETLS